MIRTVKVKDVFETFCYFYINEKTKHGFIIDPGAEPDRLLTMIRENGWVVEKILLTHGHFDHTGAVQKISEELQIPYMIHENGGRYLKDTRQNLSAYCGRWSMLEEAVYLKDGEAVQSKSDPGCSLQVLHTPGHTTDSVVFYNQQESIAFVGDTIFKGNIGNAGYPGGNMRQLQKSIVNRIFSLPADTVLYSGHSEKTTVGTELCRYM
ncbi:MAG: MBL fold metallo-hydrolase [Eubacteriales bacterium]|nr:MBL fold metallo-hydrolase [Eubacteriales bacterium]